MASKDSRELTPLRCRNLAVREEIHTEKGAKTFKWSITDYGIRALNSNHNVV